MLKLLPIQIPTVKLLWFRDLLFCFFLIPFNLIAQKSDTVLIRFNENFKEMRRDDFTKKIQAGSPDEKLRKSIFYYIKQMEPACGYDNEFRFSHVNYSKKAYNKFGGEPPVILHKAQSYLRDKKVLDINFFRTTPYREIAKTFEEEESWEQDVLIFLVGVDEIKNDSVVLREVTFGRPVKE